MNGKQRESSTTEKREDFSFGSRRADVRNTSEEIKQVYKYSGPKLGGTVLNCQ